MVRVHHILCDYGFDKIIQLFEIGITEIGGVTLTKADFRDRTVLDSCHVCTISKAYLRKEKKKLPKRQYQKEPDLDETDPEAAMKNIFPLKYKDRIIHHFEDFKLGELWFADLTGPFILSWDKKLYNLTVMEAKSRFVMTFTLPSKDKIEVVNALIVLYD